MNYYCDKKKLSDKGLRFDIDYIKSEDSKVSYNLIFGNCIFLNNRCLFKLPLTVYQERLLSIIKIFVTRSYNKSLTDKSKQDLGLYYMYQWVKYSSFIVEDASDDNTAKILKEIENRMNRIKNYIEEKLGEALKDEIQKDPKMPSMIVRFFEQGYKIGTLSLGMLKKDCNLNMNDILDWNKNMIKSLEILKVISYARVFHNYKRLE